MDLRSFLSEELWLFILFAIVLALAVPEAGLHVTPYAIYFLLVVMFLTSLRISLGEVKEAFKDRRFMLTALVLIYVASPSVAFLLSFFLEADLAVGLILYSAIPSAMANAFYISRLGKDAATSLTITAVTTLIAPLTAPIIVKVLTGYLIEMNTADLFFSLVKLVLVPFAAAEIVRRSSRPLTRGLLSISKPVTNICIFFVIFGVISGAAGQVWALGWLAVIMAVFLAFCFSAGYFSARRKRVEMAFANGFRNGTLAMVVGLEVFGPVAALVGVMSTLLHNMVLVPLMYWSRKR